MTRKLALLALVPALAVGLSACGSSGSDPGSPTSSTSSMPMPSTTSGSAGPTSSPASPASAEVVISIKDFTYEVPATVAPGATITIKNADSQAHSVSSKQGGFDVKVAPDGTATLTAPTKPGSYPFVCTFHGNMTSALVVK